MPAWSSARTTTWSNRSAPASWSRGSRRVLRRTGERADAAALVNVGALRLDPPKRTVRLGENFLDLTTREFDLLHTFMGQPGRVFTRDELLNRVWGADFAGIDRVVDVHVSNLRQKLEPSDLLVTVRGLGYKLAEDS